MPDLSQMPDLENDGPNRRGGGNARPDKLRFLSPQPGTSLHCRTTDTGLVHRAVCLFTSQLSLSLTRGGMARLSWLHGCCILRWFTRLLAVTHPSTNRARRGATMEHNVLTTRHTH